MCNFKCSTVSIFIFLCQQYHLVAAISDPYQHEHKYAPQDVDYYSHPKYAFKYGVSDPKTGDHKTQTEIRDGEVVKGQYSLVEPDGSIRVVNYVADPVNGFNAVVSRTGPNVHVEPEQNLAAHHVAPSYIKEEAPVVPHVQIVPAVIKEPIPPPPVLDYPKPIVKYTSAIGYPMPPPTYYGDYDTAYAYPGSYDLHDYYGELHGRY